MVPLENGFHKLIILTSVSNFMHESMKEDMAEHLNILPGHVEETYS